MPKQSRFAAIVRWGGVGAAALILLIGLLFPSDYHDHQAPSRMFRIGIRLDHCELDIPLTSDLAALPPHFTPGWRNRYVVGINDGMWLAVREAVGVPARGQQIRVHVQTWWLLVALLLPGVWRWATLNRAKRAALMAGRCTTCGYDLRGSGDICPECGAARTNESVSARWVSAQMWRRRPLLTAAAALSLLLALLIAYITIRSGDGHRPALEWKLTGEWKFEVDRGHFSISNEDVLLQSRYLYGSEWLGIRVAVLNSATTTYCAFSAFFIYPLLAALILPLLWWRVQRRDRRIIAARSCRWCWFDMQGATGPCPRCGNTR